ncbi:hypothetical protein [Deinococcus enclensis]|uniref:Uncharacterized protein n=1 Tax=Deinococcus enclensis TaxID=1049582 RepID=A0ABT9MEY5_9DEIO|nr:hypothetical protein [Deinococcus enclensis]MDP9765122.1 hypothetical protein [Deinococcus enclensis]
MTAASPDLARRWAEQFPVPLPRRPLPPGFSAWAAREQSLAELRQSGPLADAVRTAYAAAVRAHGQVKGASRAQQPQLQEDTCECLYAACVLAQPVIARHFPPESWTEGWFEARSVVTAFGEAHLRR